MEPQPPRGPSPATFAQHHHRQHRAPESSPYDREHARAEQDRHQQDAPRVERGSKGSSRSHAHDSVISHPLSPKAPSPPSPSSSSVSSARRHRSISEIQHAPAVSDAVSYPPRAHLDPEKAASSPRSQRSPTRVSASNADVTAAVIYDSGEYHDKGPEDKPVQLLVCVTSTE